jgi:hypothetical protein
VAFFCIANGQKMMFSGHPQSGTASINLRPSLSGFSYEKFRRSLVKKTKYKGGQKMPSKPIF